jgi:hypothetical protein
MDIKQIKEMLANPDVRQVVEEQIQKAVADKQAELDAEKATLAEAKKVAEKEAFILRKTVLAKSALYETKLKEYYETKFNEAKKKLGKEVYEFVNEAVKNLTKTIEEEAKSSNSVVRMQEAFAQAVRVMAPHMNINELAEANQSKIQELSDKLNAATKKIKSLETKALAGDLHTLVVSECAGYPIDKVALLYETVLKMAPKSLTEGREALDAAKSALKEKELEVAAEKQLAESKKVKSEVMPEQKDRAKIKVIAEGIKAQKATAAEAATSAKLTKSNSALDYDIFLG